MVMAWGVLRRVAPLAGALGIGLVLAWVWQENRWQARYASMQAQHERALSVQAAERTALIIAEQTRRQAQEAQIAALDEQYTRDLNHARENNRVLRDQLDDGTRRLRIAGENVATCRASATAGAAGVDHDAAVELTAAAGRAIFDIRAGIIEDQMKLEACQAYVRAIQSSSNP